MIETKNSSVNVIEGLPQLLTYAFKSLDQQPSVWGLVTNGQLYQFVYLRHDNQSTYELMPLLNLIQSSDAIELLQVFKGICKLPNFQ
ncbi:MULTISPECIES: hypothetical protein [unclassified Nostoc]|uniref:hypothetical protein n=1 Tax=unclassified Nostoc TaxID=2593658 RepID=UPI002FF5CC9B